MIGRLKSRGHEITVVTKHPQFGNDEWQGTAIMPGQDMGYVNELLEKGRYDYVFTLWDIWLLSDKRKFPKDKWVAYVPIDSDQISARLYGVVKETGVQIAMSKHGLGAMRDAGLEPVYAPHAVDMSTLRPDEAARAAFRSGFGWGDETFVIGSVGLNYRDDRKGFIPLMQAFKAFHDRHPDSRLYLHTDNGKKGGDTVPFYVIARSLGIAEWVAWPDQAAYYLNLIDEDWLRAVYNGMDAFCLPTRGEGFGIPTVDAQSCGVPVIVSNNTSGPELCKTGWLIDVYERDLRWMMTDAWRHEPQCDAVLERLEEAYAEWRDGDAWRAKKAQARERIAEYDWSAVWDKYWEPLWKMLEDRLAG